MDAEHYIDLHPLPTESIARERTVFSFARRAPLAVTYRRGFKRTLDVVIALVGLVVLSPAFVVIALAIKLDSRGPVFYRSRRVGYGGRPLRMLKFRKMRDDAVGLPLTGDRDARLTRVGRFLTETRLDELPQLWDVLRGRMSVIGPRPEDPDFVAMHRGEYELILSVRPGLTGLSQIAYKQETRIVDPVRPVEDYTERILPQKLTLDGLYASRCSLRLDVQIAYWTAVTVALGLPVSVHRLTGRMTLRKGRPTAAGARPADAAASGPLSAGIASPPTVGQTLGAGIPEPGPRADANAGAGGQRAA